MSTFIMMMVVFLALVFLGVPVSFSIGISTMAGVLTTGMPLAFMSLLPAWWAMSTADLVSLRCCFVPSLQLFLVPPLVQ